MTDVAVRPISTPEVNKSHVHTKAGWIVFREHAPGPRLPTCTVFVDTSRGQVCP